MDYSALALVFLLGYAFAGSGKDLAFLLFGISRFALIMLSALIHLVTIMIACSSSVMAAVLTMFLPLVSEVYWIGAAWAKTGTLDHDLTRLVVAWLVLVGVELVGRRIFAERLAQMAQ